MATTISAYNHTAQLIASGTCISGDTYKIVLLDNNASFTASDTTLSEVTNSGAWEVWTSEWAQNGVTLSGVSISQSGNDAAFDATDVSVSATTTTIGPASAAVIYNDTDAGDPPLFYIDFGAPQAAQVGSSFVIGFDTNGIFRLVVT